VAALLKKEFGTEIETTGGKTGEFTVWVGDKLARKEVAPIPE